MTAFESREKDRAALIETVKEWGYFDSVFRDQSPLLEGRRLLDIGMGGGPLSIAAIELAGCAEYVGVDPMIGRATVRNPRADTDPTQPTYCPFPYSPADIMRLYPNIHLYSGLLEEVKEKVRGHRVDMAYMASVTEHLQQLPTVFETIWECLEPGGHIWFTHHGYHSWTGHHRYPRIVKDWNREDPEHNAVTDWKHLEPDHPSYLDSNFNRVRLADFQALVEKYFDIVSWRYWFDAAERLTPEIRQRYKKYTLEELLGRTATVVARRRDRPLDTDLSKIPFFQPAETYLQDIDHSGDSLEKYALCGSIFFASPNRICSHSDNDMAAAKVFALLKPNDRIRLAKGLIVSEFTADQIVLPEGGTPSVFVREPISETVFNTSRTDWALIAIQKRRGGHAEEWEVL